jgi:hypothetical protein
MTVLGLVLFLEYGSDRFARRGRLLHWQGIGDLGGYEIGGLPRMLYQAAVNLAHLAEPLRRRVVHRRNEWSATTTSLVRPRIAVEFADGFRRAVLGGLLSGSLKLQCLCQLCRKSDLLLYEILNDHFSTKCRMPI